MFALRLLRTAVVTLLLGLGAAGIYAPGAEAQNGLQRFEKDIKPQLELKSFAYERGTPLGDQGFVLEKVTAVVPANDATGGKDTTIKIDRVTVEKVDFARLTSSNKDDVPLYAKLTLEGMTGDDTVNGMFDEYGIPKVPVDINVEYHLDPKAKVLTLSNLEMVLRGQGSLSLALVLEGVSDKTAEAVAGAADNSRLRNATLTFNDAGLMAQLVPAMAKQQGSTPQAMIAETVMPLGAFAADREVAPAAVLTALGHGAVLAVTQAAVRLNLIGQAAALRCTAAVLPAIEAAVLGVPVGVLPATLYFLGVLPLLRAGQLLHAPPAVPTSTPPVSLRLWNPLPAVATLALDTTTPMPEAGLYTLGATWRCLASQTTVRRAPSSIISSMTRPRSALSRATTGAAS